MIEWSLVSEYLALILIAIVALSFYDPDQPTTPRRRLFWACLGVSALAVVLNIASVYTLKFLPGAFALNFALCTLYFLVCVIMSTAVCYYLLQRVYEFVYDKSWLMRLKVVLTSIAVAFTLLLLWNVQSGVLFSIDGAGEYLRGPLNPIGYAASLLEAIVVVVAFLRNRESVGRAMTRIVRIAFPAVVLLVVFQLMFPEQLLNGAIGAVTVLIIYIGFQSCRIERDPLTGIANRQSFADELSLRLCGRQHCQIILVALRDFMRVNQVYGHPAGDSLLVQMSQALHRALPEGQVFRYNSVEFLLLAPGAGASSRARRLAAVRKCMDSPWKLGEYEVAQPYCTVDFPYTGQEFSSEKVVSYLEYCVRLAKDEKRDVVRFDSDIVRRYERREYVIGVMREALEEGRFQVWYQPIYYRERGTFASAEALLRLFDKQGRAISPEEFVPIAEQVGLTDELNWVVIEQVCELFASGRAPGLTSVTVNLSMRELMQRDLGHRITAKLAKHGVDPSCLKLEVTERILAENEHSVGAYMEDMVRHGLEFLLDDFGTGYSNLSRVLNLPFCAVKLDKSLMDGITCDSKAQMVTEALIQLFHKMGQAVVAEGIETAEQARRALELGADRIQGFYFARPMPADELVTWLNAKEREAGR